MGGLLPRVDITTQILQNQKTSTDVGKYGVAFGFAQKGKPDYPVLLKKTKDFEQQFGSPSVAYDSKFHYAALHSLSAGPVICMRIGKNILSGGAVIVKSGASVGEITEVTAVAVTALSQGDYFSICSPTKKYQVWFDIDGAGTGAPTTPNGEINVKVSVATGDDASDVALAIATALDALTTVFDAAAVAAVATVTNLVNGAVLEAPSDVSGAGFTFDVTQEGLANHSMTAGLSDPESYAFGSNELLAFVGATYGDEDNNIGVRIVDITADTFIVEVYAPNAIGTVSRVESFTVSRVKTKKDGYGKSMYITDKINGKSAYITVIDNTVVAETELPEAQAATLQCGGGDSGDEPTNTDIVTALDNLSDINALRIYVFPDCGYTHSTVQTKIVSMCEAAKAGLALLSIPAGSTPAEAIAHKAGAGVSSKYAAYYYPNTVVADTVRDRLGILLPSSVALQYAYLKPTTDYFTVPLGEDFLLPGNIETVLSAEDAQLVLDSEINPIMFVTGVGNYPVTENTALPTEGFEQRISVMLLLNYTKWWYSTNFTGLRFKRFTTALLQVADNRAKTLVAYLLGREAILDGSITCNETNNDLNSNTLVVAQYMSPSSLVMNLRVDITITEFGIDLSASLA